VLQLAHRFEKTSVKGKPSVRITCSIFVTYGQYPQTLALPAFRLTLSAPSLPTLAFLLALSFPPLVVAPRLGPRTRQRAADGDNGSAERNLACRQEHDHLW